MASPCGHVFCSTCISSSLHFRATCPICQKPVQPTQLTKLFLWSLSAVQILLRGIWPIRALTLGHNPVGPIRVTEPFVFKCSSHTERSPLFLQVHHFYHTLHYVIVARTYQNVPVRGRPDCWSGPGNHATSYCHFPFSTNRKIKK